MLKSEFPIGTKTIRSYSEFEKTVSRFANGNYSLLLIIGSPGIAKSQIVKRALVDKDHLDLSTHATALGMYQLLHQHKDEHVVIDDLDSIYNDRASVRLLKSLCNTDAVKTLQWTSNARCIGYAPDKTPPQFTTTSPVCLIANQWKTLNQNVAAINDRAIIVHFDPPPLEVHEQTRTWFDDHIVFNFIGDHLHLIAAPSMRYYVHGNELRQGDPDWESWLLVKMGVSEKLVDIFELIRGSKNRSKAAEKYEAMGKGSRPTFYRQADKLPPPLNYKPKRMRQRKPKIRLVGGG